MINYGQYAEHLYNKAKIYTYVRYVFLSITLISLLLSVIYSGEKLYISTVTALISYIIAWVVNEICKKVNNLANEFHQHGLLSSSYPGENDSFKVSHLIANANINNNKEIDIDNSRENKEPLSYKIHENSYWNHHQYRALFKFYVTSTSIFFFLIISATLYAIPFSDLNANYIIPRLAFTVLSFSILYEIIENSIRLYDSSKRMLEIDNEISRHVELSESKIIDIYQSYTKLIEITPNIPKFVYNMNKVNLNKGWSIRKAEIYDGKK